MKQTNDTNEENQEDKKKNLLSEYVCSKTIESWRGYFDPSKRFIGHIRLNACVKNYASDLKASMRFVKYATVVHEYVIK